MIGNFHGKKLHKNLRVMCLDCLHNMVQAFYVPRDRHVLWTILARNVDALYKIGGQCISTHTNDGHASWAALKRHFSTEVGVDYSFCHGGGTRRESSSNFSAGMPNDSRRPHTTASKEIDKAQLNSCAERLDYVASLEERSRLSSAGAKKVFFLLVNG